MTRILLGLVLTALVAYGLWEAYPLVLGPSLAVSAPVEGARYPDGVATIAGRVARATTLTLNGGPLLAEQAGRFETTLAFPRGGSILTFVATDRFGRSVTRQRYIYVP